MRGKYRKYKDKFVESLLEGDTEVNVGYLVNMFLEFMEDECERCMSNRMMCALRPACPNRKFLNLLLRFGVDAKDLPNFCYEQQLSNVNTYLEGSSKTKIIDTVLPIKEFLKLLSGGGERLIGPLREGNVEKLSKELFIEFKRATPDVLASVGEDYILVLIDNGLFYFDLSCDIVVINPRDTIIKSKGIISDLINIYREKYKLNLELREEFEGLWYLDVLIPLNSKNKNIKEIKGVIKNYEQKLLNNAEYVSDYFSDNTLNLVLEIKTPSVQQKCNIMFRNVSEIFNLINNIIKEINQPPSA